MVELQCGYEDDCKSKDCLHCPRVYTMTITVTEAEMSCVEDIGTCDIPIYIKEKTKEFDLLQNVMKGLMKKLFKGEKKDNIDH